MKFLLLMMSLILSASGYAANTKYEGGTADVDAKYLDELKTLNSAQEKLKGAPKTREAYEENPRNPAMVESFSQLYSKEDDQEKQEARETIREIKQKQDLTREGKPAQGAVYEDDKVWPGTKK